MLVRKHKILFVDDEPFILQGIRRSTEEYTGNWIVDFATSGSEALKKLASESFDAVVTDMLMPGMDGVTLLKEVTEDHPGVLRFVLSGNTRDENILQATHLVHQMFPKPCDIDYVYKVVERSCLLRDMVSEPNLIRIITGIRSLPSAPTLYNNLLVELQSKEPDPQLVGDIIAQDPAMTAKILQLVNSAFFGLPNNISNPQRAVVILGLNTIKALTLGIHIFSEFKSSARFPISIETIWNHSLLVSNLARKIARILKLTPQDQEDAQVAGILHDTGKLLEYRIPNFFSRIQIDNGYIPPKSEYQTLGTSHAEMGAYLLGGWGLPNQIVEAVLLHHNPGMQVSDTPNIISVLHIANGLMNMYRAEKKVRYEPYLDVAYVNKMGLSEKMSDWEEECQVMLNADPRISG